MCSCTGYHYIWWYQQILCDFKRFCIMNPCLTVFCRIQEKEVKLKSMEKSLQAAQDSSSTREKTVEVWAFLYRWNTGFVRVSRDHKCYSSCCFCHFVLVWTLVSEAAFVSQSLEQQLAALQAEMEQLRQKEMPEELTSSGTQLQELQAQWVNPTKSPCSPPSAALTNQTYDEQIWPAG